MANVTKTVCVVAEAEKLVPNVRESYRQAGTPEPPGGITGWFVLAIALDLYRAVLEGRAIPIPKDVYRRTAGILNAVGEEQHTGEFEITERRPVRH